MRSLAIREPCRSLTAAIRATLIAMRSVARGLPLFISPRPGTPLRVLCIMAFDAVHTLRHARPIPRARLDAIAAFLDLGACANAAFDRKPFRRHERRATLRLLERAGLRSFVTEYLKRLRELETSRPSPGGDRSRFHEVKRYREDVVRLSLGMLTSISNGTQNLDDGIQATASDPALQILFRIVMLCQMIDDIKDYRQDTLAGLPSFLTASRNFNDALNLTREAAHGYADPLIAPRTGETITLRCALWLVSACAKLAIVYCRLDRLIPSSHGTTRGLKYSKVRCPRG